jgi:hypothetical protein
MIMRCGKKYIANMLVRNRIKSSDLSSLFFPPQRGARKFLEEKLVNAPYRVFASSGHRPDGRSAKDKQP